MDVWYKMDGKIVAEITYTKIYKEKFFSIQIEMITSRSEDIQVGLGKSSYQPPGSNQASIKVEPQLLLKVFLLQSDLQHHRISLLGCFLRHLFHALQPGYDQDPHTFHALMYVLQFLRSLTRPWQNLVFLSHRLFY